MKLSSVLGHVSAVEALRRALEADQLAGTYLFVGPHGIGKTTLALAFAQAAACLNPVRSPFDACGQCDSCIRAESGANPELALISPAGDLTQIWQFWDRDGRPPGILQHTLCYAPGIGRKRVYIIERADTLNEPAANSLLKALEEPPPYALFVLLAPHPSRLLPTILSRAQKIRLSRSPAAEVAAFLMEREGLDADRARAVAAYSEGRFGTALSLARTPGVEVEIGKVVDFVAGLPGTSRLGALRAAEAMRKLGASLKALAGDESAQPDDDSAQPDSDDASTGPKERLGRRQLGPLLDAMIAAYRDLLALRLGGTETVITHTSRADQLSRVAETRSAAAWMASLEDLMLARRRVDQNINTRMLTDWLTLRLVCGEPESQAA